MSPRIPGLLLPLFLLATTQAFAQLPEGPPAPVAPEVVSRDDSGRATIRAVRAPQPLRIDGVLGIIPGSMGTPGYVVRGKGVASSLNSASHGAGRRMSRTKAKELFNWDVAQQFLRERGVTLLSAGLDEVPMAYKDIDEVMAAQQDLVEPLARFEPRLVKMAPGDEPAED